ncbi:Protein unc-80 [Tyrophagus putrescentiae]|nr:Protein unc-80 [Tyrophagus putrescentiae]
MEDGQLNLGRVGEQRPGGDLQNGLLEVHLQEEVRRLPMTTIIIRPLILEEKVVDHLLHRQIRYQLVGGEAGSRHRVKVAHSLQVLLNVLAVVGDAAGGDHRVGHDLEADLPAEVVGHFAAAYLSPVVDLHEEIITRLKSLLEGRVDQLLHRADLGLRRLPLLRVIRYHLVLDVLAQARQLLLLVGENEAVQVGLQLDLLLDALLLEHVPALLARHSHLIGWSG